MGSQTVDGGASGYLIVAILLALVALLAAALSLAMPGWVLDEGSNPSFSGLWFTCANWTQCTTLVKYAYMSKEMTVWMTMWVTQSLGNLLLLCSVIAGLVALCNPNRIPRARFLLVVFSLFAGFSLLSGVLVFLVVNSVTVQQSPAGKTKHYFYSLYLSVGATVMAWIAALVASLHHQTTSFSKKMSMPPGFDVINVGNLQATPLATPGGDSEQQ